MTVTVDAKKRVVIPGAAPGDVFSCEETKQGVVLRRVYRRPAAASAKRTKAQVRKAIRGWKSLKGVKWEELRKITRES